MNRITTTLTTWMVALVGLLTGGLPRLASVTAGPLDRQRQLGRDRAATMVEWIMLAAFGAAVIIGIRLGLWGHIQDAIANIADSLSTNNSAN